MSTAVCAPGLSLNNENFLEFAARAAFDAPALGQGTSHTLIHSCPCGNVLTAQRPAHLSTPVARCGLSVALPFALTTGGVEVDGDPLLSSPPPPPTHTQTRSTDMGPSTGPGMCSTLSPAVQESCDGVGSACFRSVLMVVLCPICCHAEWAMRTFSNSDLPFGPAVNRQPAAVNANRWRSMAKCLFIKHRLCVKVHCLLFTSDKFQMYVTREFEILLRSAWLPCPCRCTLFGLGGINEFFFLR